MSRAFGKVLAQLWHSEKFRTIGPLAKLVYLYFHTNTHGNSIGCYRLPKLYMLADLDLPSDAVASAVRELVKAGLVEWDHQEPAVRIVDFLVASPPQNPKHRLGVEAQIRLIGNGAWRQSLHRELRRGPKTTPREASEKAEQPDRVSIPYGDGSITVSDKTETETETLPTNTESRSPTVATAARSRPAPGGVYPQAFETFWRAWRSKPRASNDPKQAGFRAWKTHCQVVDIEAVLAGVKRYKASANVQRGFHQQAERWIRNRGWLDDYDESPQGGEGPAPRGFVG